ncbi:MAG: redoxin domain-containing protein [Synergistaceae bacterium]|jgi:peroxiredoxin|nr:redoxin domain-containing protein [Synergistaceae bacterium]
MGKRYHSGSVVDDFSFTTPWGGEKQFSSAGAGKKKVLYFLRYYGCNLTKLAFREIAGDFARFAEKGVQVWVAIQSSTETVRSEIKEGEFPFEIICDPEGTLYRLFDIGYLHIGFFIKGLAGTPPRDPTLEKQFRDKMEKANALGITHGIYEGCEQQLPAVFVIDENRTILLAHYARDLSDLPETEELLKAL